LVTDRSSIIVGVVEEAGAGGASDRSAVAIRPDYVNGFTMVVKSGLILAISRRHAARSLHASGAAKPDRHLLAVDDHRHRAASLAVAEHPLERCRVLLDVQIFKRNLPPTEVLTGGLRVRSGVLAEDVDHPSL
jgi:hypothetical protein